MKKLIAIGNWFYYLLFCISLSLTWFFHKDATRFDDRNELWSDRAGYYIYLPATFFYHFDTHQMPADLDIRTGGGFAIDTLNNKIDTKYTYGVSLLASPFFLASGLISRVAGYDSENGFSMIYMRMMMLAAVVYLTLGLWLLKKILDQYFSQFISCFTFLLIFLGTNLFYYSLIDGMMSHVYSFLLFTLFLYSLQRFRLTGHRSWFLLLSLAFSLIILIRPTNMLIGFLFFTWDETNPSGWMKNLRQLLKTKYFLSLLAILFIVFLPQLIYWKYLSGHWLHFSYGKEGFLNWRHPRIAEVLLSPVNGLITTTPLILFMLAGIAGMIFRKRTNGRTIAFFFIFLTLICASWSMWYFGCSQGQRSFIEYYAILAVPLGWLISGLFNSRSFLLKTMVLFLIFLMVYANLRYTIVLYRFDRCYYGSTWDWDHYRRTFERAGVISPVHRISSYKNDFENLALCPVRSPSAIFTRSGQYSIACEKNGQTPLFSIRLDDFGYPYPKMMEVEAWVLKPGTRPAEASLDYTLNRGFEVLFSDRQPVDTVLKEKLTWLKVKKIFIIPDVNDSSLQINIFISNPKHALLYVDDLCVRYKYNWN